MDSKMSNDKYPSSSLFPHCNCILNPYAMVFADSLANEGKVWVLFEEELLRPFAMACHLGNEEVCRTVC